MPILMSKQELERIKRWTDENREEADTVRRREYLKYLDETSREMTKRWPNSVENVNKRNEELRRARHDVQEQANIRFYRRYVKRQFEEQERLMHTARETIFKNTDAPKLLLSGVIESAVQKERQEQIKFKNELKRQEEEANSGVMEGLVRQAKQWNELQEGKTRKKREVNKQIQKEIVKQAEEKRSKERREAAEELARQIEDIQRQEQEMDAIREFEEDFNAKERKRIWEDNEQSLKETRQRRLEVEAKDKLEDDLLQVLADSKVTIEKRRRETELKLRKEKLRILDVISQRLAVGTSVRDAKEQASLEAAQAERLASEQARHQAWLAKEAKNRAECIAAHEQWLREQAQREHEAKTTKKWELMNRFKNVELYQDYLEDLSNKKAREIEEYRTEINRLRKERVDRDEQAAREEREFYGDKTTEKFRNDDNRVFTLAAQLVQEARDLGRPELPILKSIDRYCKHYRLYPMPDLPASLQKAMPKYATRDLSRPDADYRPPTPPPPDKGPDAPDDDDDAPLPSTANGLQELIKNAGKPKKSSKAEKKPEPANGLQGVKELVEGMLPPIGARAPDCRCGNK